MLVEAHDSEPAHFEQEVFRDPPAEYMALVALCKWVVDGGIARSKLFFFFFSFFFSLVLGWSRKLQAICGWLLLPRVATSFTRTAFHSTLSHRLRSNSKVLPLVVPLGL